jgi:hypothetical protein
VQLFKSQVQQAQQDGHRLVGLLRQFIETRLKNFNSELIYLKQTQYVGQKNDKNSRTVTAKFALP